MAQSYQVYKLKSGDSVLEYYPDTAQFSPSPLYWNSGNGYFTTSVCILHTAKSLGKDVGYYYAGSGSPANAEASVTKSISALVGAAGYVAASNDRTWLPNSAEVVSAGTATQYVREVTASDDGAYGGINSQNQSSVTGYSKGFLAGGTAPITKYGTRSDWTAVPKENCVFVCWEVDGEEVTTTDATAAIHVIDAGNKRLVIKQDYAQDCEDVVAVFAPKFTVSFKGNGGGRGGAGSPPDQEFVYGVEQALWESDFIRTGYVQTGWNTKKDGSGISVELDGDASTLTDEPGATVNLYAQWQEAKVTAEAQVPDGYPGDPIALDIDPPGEYDAWTAGTTVTVSAPDKGVGVTFDVWSSTGVEGTPGTAADGTHTYTFTMPEGNVSVTAIYDYSSITVTATVHTASLPAVTPSGGSARGVTITDTNGDAFTQGHPVYGEKAKLTAPLPVETADSAFSFDGWYDASGVCKSTELSYVTDELVADVSFFAKYKVKVAVGIDPNSDQGTSGFISVNGTDYDQRTADVEVPVTLGDSIEIKATELANSYFGGWYVNGSLSSLEAEATVVPAVPSGGGKPTYKANFAATAPTYTVYVSSTAMSAGTEGTLALIGAAIVSGENGEYVVKAHVPVNFQVTPSSAADALPFYRIDETNSTGTETLARNIDKDNPIRVAEDKYYRAFWGTPEPVGVAVAVSPTDVSKGVAFIGDAKSSAFVSVDMDSEVTVVAMPLNGYKFVEWKDAEGVSVSTLARYTFAASADISLTAHFDEDDYAICAWEGSDESKEMEWTSKTFVSQKPFDPVAARVDAAGYPVSLTVRTHSSPDVEDPLPVRNHAIEVQSQDGRRLGRMRPERYVRFTVNSTHEVDAVVIGTNMAEVN